jgi:hypothetical protein
LLVAAVADMTTLVAVVLVVTGRLLVEKTLVVEILRNKFFLLFQEHIP